jgi:hypothetical protein
MGEPVRILDLATDMIRLSGLEVGKDIEIRYTGMRPGERLFEERFFRTEDVAPTSHPKIVYACNEILPAGFPQSLQALLAAALECHSDEELRRLLKVLVPEFATPTPHAPAVPAAARRVVPAWHTRPRALVVERRDFPDRRVGERRSAAAHAHPAERRAEGDRRSGLERRRVAADSVTATPLASRTSGRGVAQEAR